MRQSVTMLYSQPTSVVLSIVYSSLYLLIITLINIYLLLPTGFIYLIIQIKAVFMNCKMKLKIKFIFPLNFYQLMNSI